MRRIAADEFTVKTMVSIVIVSHSRKLAEGVRELVDQMVGELVPIAYAAGIDDPENAIGTDPMKVLEAIESVYSPDGTVVLMDLGSALLSAETALDFLEPERRSQIRLCAAPLVEGALAAAVQASLGSNVQEVLREARNALDAKTVQLQPLELEGSQDSSLEPPAVVDEDHHEIRLTVNNRLGLHARPAAKLVSTAGRFQAQIRIEKEGKTISAKSINQVVTLAVRKGDEILISAEGPDAPAALQALQKLAESNFGESDREASQQEPVRSRSLENRSFEAEQLSGVPVSAGIAVGPAFLYRPELPEVEVRRVEDVSQERERLHNALAKAKRELESAVNRAARQSEDDRQGILQVHRLILEDPVILDSAEGDILSRQINAEAAWQQAIEQTAASYRVLADEYLRERSADVLDAGRRVLLHLLNAKAPAIELEEASIIVASELSPSDVSRLDAAKVLGICTAKGGATSHSVILARSLGIPMVVGVSYSIDALANGQIVALDGTTGRVWLKPDPATRTALEGQRRQWLEERSRGRADSGEAAVTRDGKRIHVAANIGGSRDAALAIEHGAEGVGLLRTELMFMDRQSPPSEEEQLTFYREIAGIMEQRPLIIRTLDVGGDKCIPYLDIEREENPFLGERGIRYCLNHPELFKVQLRAILRAGVAHNLKIMFPMVAHLEEVRQAKILLDEVRKDLCDGALSFDEGMEVGIMIEVPSAVILADQLAAEVDFFSIGTNDLSQYVMSADRGNAKVATLPNALHPAVLRMIQRTVEAAHAANIWVGICGELAANVLAVPVLAGLGIDELSLSAPGIPALKAAIRETSLSEADQIAQTALALDSAAAVETYLRRTTSARQQTSS